MKHATAQLAVNRLVSGQWDCSCPTWYTPLRSTIYKMQLRSAARKLDKTFPISNASMPHLLDAESACELDWAHKWIKLLRGDYPLHKTVHIWANYANIYFFIMGGGGEGAG